MSKTIDDSVIHDDWRNDLFRDGYVVVKGAVSAENSKKYLENMFQWLEKFPYGFDRKNPETWDENHLPTHIKGGMYHGYSVQHEKFIWEAREEPGVIDAFAKLWNTDNLLVSFDGMNLTLPTASRTPSSPWPHVDQSPLRKGLQCVQGVINLAPNGPNDGGLMVMKGSHKLNETFFTVYSKSVDRPTWGPVDWFGFEEEETKWFENKGCELLKVCAEPGDLILWDSRTVHYNRIPNSNSLRAAIYVCYSPASFAAPEDLSQKAKLFENRIGTSHWPHANVIAKEEKELRLGKPDIADRDRPFDEPVISEKTLKLAGVMPY